ncbi:MAG: hypothetical protein EXS13_01420 [Planctomycetes bacterium]|nr:hypothetical protein [Planctomycetota bacterium]
MTAAWIAPLACVALFTSVAPPPTAPPRPRSTAASADFLLAPTRVEASLDDSGELFESIAIDGGAGGKEWQRARLTFALPAVIETGAWMLAVGGPDLAAQVTLNRQALGTVPDVYADEPVLRFGPRFTLSAARFPAGSVTFEVAFTGERRGRGLERGPAWLASPLPADRAFQSAQVDGQVFGPANFASAVTITSDGLALERICFKSIEDGDLLRAAGQLDFSLVDRDRGGEVTARKLAMRRGTAIFPTSSVTWEDGRFAALQTQVAITAGIATSPLRFCDSKVIVVEVTQTVLRTAFQHFWNIRFMPGIGGPLRVTREKGMILLANERVGLVATAGLPIGDESAPCGIEIELTSTGGGAPDDATPKSRPASMLLAVVGFEPAGDPSQADSMLDLARSVLADCEANRAAAGLLAGSIALEPSIGAATLGTGARKAAIATLSGAARRGTRYMFAPGGSTSSPEAFWGDTFSLLHFPNHERGAVELLLASIDDDGALRLDQPGDAGDVELAAAGGYAVLRACRWLRWTNDGDRFKPMLAPIERALGFADRCDLSPAPASRDVTPLHAALVRAAAHRELAATLNSIGLEAAASARHGARAEQELAQLLAAPGDGGRLDAEGFAELSGGDARDAAVALALELVDGSADAAVAKQVAPGKRPYDETDWRDALVARGLLVAGRTKTLGRWLDTVDNRWKQIAQPEGAGIASWHGVLLFGMLGARRHDFGTFELRPRIPDYHFLRTTIRLPEGPLRFNVSVPDGQFERQVIVINDSSSDLLVRLGIPNGSAAGERVTHGDLVHAFHGEVLSPKETWRTRLR